MTALISDAGDKIVTLSTSVSFFHLFYGTDAGVFIGAFAGAVVYVLSDIKLSHLAQIGAFIASFFIGILASEMTSSILTSIISRILMHHVEVNKDIGATVSAATGVYFLLTLRKFNFLSFLQNLLSGGSRGNNDK